MSCIEIMLLPSLPGPNADHSARRSASQLCDGQVVTPKSRTPVNTVTYVLNEIEVEAMCMPNQNMHIICNTKLLSSCGGMTRGVILCLNHWTVGCVACIIMLSVTCFVGSCG